MNFDPVAFSHIQDCCRAAFFEKYFYVAIAIDHCTWRIGLSISIACHQIIDGRSCYVDCHRRTLRILAHFREVGGRDIRDGIAEMIDIYNAADQRWTLPRRFLLWERDRIVNEAAE